MLQICIFDTLTYRIITPTGVSDHVSCCSLRVVRPGRSYARSRLSRQRTELRRPRPQWEGEREYGAYADAALHRQVTAMRLRNPSGQGQAQSGVAGAATTRGVHAVEGIEEVGQVLCLNAGPGVSHRDHGAATRGTRAQADGSPLRGVGDGIVQQV